LFAAGPPDALNRTIDVTALSSWLAVRAIDRETRRLDAIERGDPPPPTPASIPPTTATLPPLATPDATVTDQPLADIPLPGRGPRRLQVRPKAAVPRPPAPNPPVMSQQAAPLPPPIEVRPAPAPAPVRPKPRPPMVITPPPN
jgi:large subunit ribosomal protein L24